MIFSNIILHPSQSCLHTAKEGRRKGTFVQLEQAVLASLPFYVHDVIRVAAQIIDTEIRAI